MLVDPSLDDLLTKVDNKFKLVTLALKRAKQINDGSPFTDNFNAAKPVSMALQEINEGYITVEEGTDKPAGRHNAPAAEDGNDALSKALTQEDELAPMSELILEPSEDFAELFRTQPESEAAADKETEE